MNKRLEYGETWIDPEEYAYPAGSLRQSRRHFAARCPDGKIRRGVCGIPDTFFSIPARLKASGKTVAGFVSIDTDHNELTFRPYTYRANCDAFTCATWPRYCERGRFWHNTATGKVIDGCRVPDGQRYGYSWYPCPAGRYNKNGSPASPQHDGPVPHGIGCPECRDARVCNECGRAWEPFWQHCTNGRCLACCESVCKHRTA